MTLQKDYIQELNWKILIVLDSCRYDYFNDVASELGLDEAELVNSNVIRTPEWYHENWNPEIKQKTILVSGNVFASRDFHFYRSYPIWRYKKLLNEFNEVPCDVMLNEASKLHFLNPYRRILVHLQPPHLPYYGPKGKKFMKTIIQPNRSYYRVVIWYGREYGWEELREYYKESLKTALEEILKAGWFKKAVITSDHGEVLGENSSYGHGSQVGDKLGEEICHRVPWYELEL